MGQVGWPESRGAGICPFIGLSLKDAGELAEAGAARPTQKNTENRSASTLLCGFLRRPRQRAFCVFCGVFEKRPDRVTSQGRTIGAACTD